MNSIYALVIKNEIEAVSLERSHMYKYLVLHPNLKKHGTVKEITSFQLKDHIMSTYDELIINMDYDIPLLAKDVSKYINMEVEEVRRLYKIMEQLSIITRTYKLSEKEESKIDKVSQMLSDFISNGEVADRTSLLSEIHKLER